MKAPCMIFDCSFICWRAYHSLKKINLSHDDAKVEIIFGFLHQIREIASVFESPLFATTFVFIWDSRINFRKKIFPAYKKKDPSDETEEEKELKQLSLEQFGRLRSEVLPAMGFKHVYTQTGMEGDDLIASVIQNNPEYDFNIISSDADLDQLLSPTVCRYNPITKKIMDLDTFKETWGIEPEAWKEVKAIGGCVSDKVPGISGVKEKTAIKYLKKQLKRTTKAYKEIESKDGKNIIERNRKLVYLPFPGTEVIKLSPQVLYEKDFITTFEHFDFKSFLYKKMRNSWKDLFSLH